MFCLLLPWFDVLSVPLSTFVGGDSRLFKVLAIFNHVGGSFKLFMATTGDV